MTKSTTYASSKIKKNLMQVCLAKTGAVCGTCLKRKHLPKTELIIS